MKKSLLLLLAVLSLSSVVIAQPRPRSDRHHSSSRHYRNDHGFLDGLRAVETAAETAMLLYDFSRLANYTGIRVGCNAASLSCSGFNGYDLNSEYNAGFAAGIVFGWYLGNTPFIIEPGLYYSMKGGTVKGSYHSKDDRYSFSSDATMHTFEIPLVLKYEIQFHNAGICLHPFFGGFVSWGCGGTTKQQTDGYSDSFDTFDDKGLNRTDAGLRTGIGMGIDHFFLEMAYDRGLVNLADSYDYNHAFGHDVSVKTNTLTFTVGFNF